MSLQVSRALSYFPNPARAARLLQPDSISRREEDKQSNREATQKNLEQRVPESKSWMLSLCGRQERHEPLKVCFNLLI